MNGFVLTMVLISLTAIGCTSGEKSETTSSGTSTISAEPSSVAPSSTKPDWSNKMQDLSQALNKLLPLVSDTKAFNNPSNEVAIRDAASRLKKLSHQVRAIEKPSADPAFDSIARMLDEDLARAVSALATGNRDYARLTIRESIGYCIQCHTQTASGPNFPKLELSFDASSLSPLGRGDFYAATRQFDRALASYQEGVKDAAYAKRDIFGWERAVKSALAIAVRFKQSPQESQKIARAVLNNKSAPESLKSAAQSWMGSIADWSKQLSNKKPEPTLTIAQKLIDQADAKQDVSAPQDVPYLRASAILHQWLSENPAKPGQSNIERAKALWLAGRAAEASRELNFWTLHERYYELCIDDAPKTETAKACFSLLSDSVVTGYTGSSGTNLPAEEERRLARLKAKAYGAPEGQ